MTISRAIAIRADGQTQSTDWPLAAADGSAAVAGPAASELYRAAKRALDFFGAVMLMVALLPVFALIGLAILLDSGWPVFYRGRRIGRYGESFTALKFRSMRAGCDQTPHAEFLRSLLNGTTCDVYKVPDDGRVTRVGAFLRRTSLDELPQLWNVVRGEMSLVGPRPDVPYAVAEYTDSIASRLRVKPGITGLWQVSGRSHLSLLDMYRLDARYAAEASFLLDISILLRTVPAVLRVDGAA
jgi:lipopolysaccharide/colanic/teichoic acid biosynthesis glycosyltransferase